MIFNPSAGIEWALPLTALLLKIWKHFKSWPNDFCMEASAALEDKKPTSDSAAKISNFFGKFIDFSFEKSSK